MRLIARSSVGLLLPLLALYGARQSQGPVPPLRMPPGGERWVDLPGQPGVKEVVLDGDPTVVGMYTLRRRYPAGYYGPPHYHPHIEYATVITGTVYVAFGDSLERAAAVALPAGSFIRVPPFTVHAVWTDGEVILQYHGPGPRSTVSGSPRR